MRTLIPVLLVVLVLIGSAVTYVHVGVKRLIAQHTTLDLTAETTPTTLPGQTGAAGSPASGTPAPASGGPG